MLITDCFAYEDVTAELYQEKDTFAVALKTQNQIDISLTLNYMQVKILVDGLLAIVNQASVKDFLATKSDFIMGDMIIKMDVKGVNEVDNKEGVEDTCRQNILSVQTEEISLSKSA